jgi:hypothetical protein
MLKDTEAFDKDEEYKETLSQLLNRVGKLAPNDLASVQDRVFKMINYAIGRLDYYEEYRRRYLQIGLAAIGLAITLLAVIGGTYFSLLTKESDKFLCWHVAVPFVALLIFVIGLAAVGFRQMLLYMAYTTPEYPYREVTRPDWFYRYVKQKADEKDLLRTKFGAVESDKKVKEKLQRNYLEDLSSYGATLIGRSREQSLVNDIEQLMALHTLTQYKLTQSNEMRRMLWQDIRILLPYGVVVIILAIVAAFVPTT